MKVFRSSRCSLQAATPAKPKILRELLAEYGRVVDLFIGRFWSRRWTKRESVRRNVAVEGTWLSARSRKVAAREAIDMVAAARERDGRWALRPFHHGQRMYVS